MKKLIIFGTGDFARYLHHLVEEAGEYRTIAFTATEAKQSAFRNLPVWDFDELEQMTNPDEVEFLVGIGYSRMNQVRKRFYEETKARGYKLASFTSPQLRSTSEVTLGEHHLILDNNTLQPFSEIGRNVIIWSNNAICHDSTVGDHCFVSSGAVVSGYAKLGEGCFLGPNSTVGAGVQLEDRVFVGPGCTVTEDLEDEAVIVAPPARLRKLPSSRLPPF